MFEYLMHYCIPISSVARRRHFRSARRHYLNTVSARMGVGHLLLPAQLPGTHWVMMCVIWHLAPTVSDVCLQLGCFQSTSTYSALELLHFMRCINSRLTYLLTDLLVVDVFMLHRCSTFAVGRLAISHTSSVGLGVTQVQKCINPRQLNLLCFAEPQSANDRVFQLHLYQHHTTSWTATWRIYLLAQWRKRPLNQPVL